MHDINWLSDGARTLADLQAEAQQRNIPTAGKRKEALRQECIQHELARIQPQPVIGQPQGQQPPQQPAQPVQQNPNPVPQLAPQPQVAPLAIIGQTTLTGQVNVPIQANFFAVGGQPPYGWNINGAPAWVAFNQGILSGTPTQVGQSQVTLTLTDGHGAPANHTVWITIQPAALPLQGHNQHGGGHHGGFNWQPWLIVAGAAIAAIFVLLVIGPPLVDWIEDRLQEFDDEHPDFVERDTDGDDGNTGGSGNNGSGTITIGGLEVNTGTDYHNGLKAGEIRTNVREGQMIVGDATVNGRPPDGDSSTGQITVLFERAETVVGTNESSFQTIDLSSWKQAVAIKATEMKLTGCMHGCSKILVYDQDGSLLGTY